MSVSTLHGLLAGQSGGGVVTPPVDIPKGYALKFPVDANQVTTSFGGTAYDVTTSFELEFENALDGFGSQYDTVFAGDVLAVIYGYVPGKYELYSGNLNIRSPFTTEVNDSAYRKLKFAYDGQFLKGYLNGIEQFSTPFAASINMPSGIRIGGLNTGLALSNNRKDNIKITVDGILRHHYTFNEETGDYLDLVSGANITESTAYRIPSTIPDFY